jgi:hypothetical protein
MSEKVYYGKDNIKPDFLTPEDSDEESDVYFSAQKELKDLEKTAEEAPEKSTSSASDIENSFKYTGRGSKSARSAALSKSFKKGGKLKSFGKKSPALLAIIGALAGLAIAFLFVGSLGNQIETLITRATDTMFGSYTENSIRITEELLAGKRGNFPKYLKDRFETQGVTVNGSKSEGFTLSFQGQTIDSTNFKNTYDTNLAFREAFTKAKRGRTSNFFDASATFAFTKLGLSRNIYRNYKTGDKTEYKKIRNSRFDNSTKTDLGDYTKRQAYDADGNPRVDTNGNPILENSSTGKISNTNTGVDSKARATSFLNSTATNVANNTAAAANYGCMALRVANMVSVSIAAAQIYQAINYFMGDIENVSKTKAGQGNAADMNAFLNFINEPVTTTYVDVEDGEEKEITGAPINAEGFANVLAGVNPDTKKTKNYSIESAFLATGTAFAINKINTKACGAIKLSSAVISIAVGLFSGGIVKTVASLAKATVVNIAAAGSVTAVLSALIPKIAKTLFENTAENLAGIPAGETFVEGAALSNKKVARSTSGQMLATKSVATSYANTTAIANKYESEIERNNKNPLDISSPDTFLGSIASKLAIITSKNPLLTNARSFSAIATNSFGHILTNLGGSVFADGEEATETTMEVAYDTVFGDKETCQHLTDIGAACDMYGVEITATDTDFFKTSYSEQEYKKVVEKNTRINSKGMREVIPNSLLAKKIMFCDERDSPFGVYDANIANALNVSLGFGDNIPILNDIIDIANAIEDMSPESEGWATGAYCVLDKDNNPYYEELVYLQHYTEDMRIATQMKLDEVTDENSNTVNPTTAYKEAYYEKNPIDTSEAGLLARYTGRTKEEAEEFIALIDYYQFLAEYEPPVEKSETKVSFNLSSSFENLAAILPSKAEYFDLRNRSYAV